MTTDGDLLITLLIFSSDPDQGLVKTSAYSQKMDRVKVWPDDRW